MGGDVERLRAVAEAATPGPWRRDRFFWKIGSTRGIPDEFWVSVEADAAVVIATMPEEAPPSGPNAEHIATFDPPTVLALLDRLAAAEDGLRSAYTVGAWGDLVAERNRADRRAKSAEAERDAIAALLDDAIEREKALGAKVARVEALAAEDDAFGDLVGRIAEQLRGGVASAVNGIGADLVRVERCYASGMAQRITRLVQADLTAVLGADPDAALGEVAP